MRPAGEAIPDLPRVVVTEEEGNAIRQGRLIHPGSAAPSLPAGTMVALVASGVGGPGGENLVAVGECLTDGRVQPRVVLGP